MYLLLSMNFRLQYRISLILIFLQWIIPLVSAASYGPNPYWDADNNVYDLGWIPLRVNSWAIIAWWNLWIGVINPGYRVDVSGYMNSSSGLCIGWDCKGSWSEVVTSIIGTGLTNYVPRWNSTGNGFTATGLIVDTGIGVGIWTSSPQVKLEITSWTPWISGLRFSNLTATLIASSSILGTTGTGPIGITTDPAGNIYTVNWSSDNVTKITPAGVSSTLGTTGTNPYGIIVDSTGNIYTANQGSNNVTKITPAGVSSTLGTTGTGPRSITIDSAGNIYTANYNSDNVTKFTTVSTPSYLTVNETGDVILNALTKGWELKGNLGTDPLTDFIGTTDNTDLVFKTDNTEHLRITSFGFVGIGTETPQSALDVNGDIAINWIPFIRYIMGDGNSIAVGDHALFNNNEQANIAIGDNAIGNLIGYESENVAIGFGALNSMISWNSNTSVGTQAGAYNNTYQPWLESWNSNSFFGFYATTSTGVIENATALWANALVSASNTMVLGSVNGINWATADTHVVIGSGSSSSWVYKLDVVWWYMNSSSWLCINWDCKSSWSQVAGSRYPGCLSDDVELSNGQIWASCDVNVRNSQFSLYQHGEMIAWTTASSWTSINDNAITIAWTAYRSSSLGVLGFSGWSNVVSDTRSWSYDKTWYGTPSSSAGPCAPGYHVPSGLNWNDAFTTLWSDRNTFVAILSFNASDYRNASDWSRVTTSNRYYWSSTISGSNNAQGIIINPTNVTIWNYVDRANAYHIRCLKDGTDISE